LFCLIIAIVNRTISNSNDKNNLCANKSNYLPIRKSNARVMYLCWHPIIDIIATSWDSGDVIIRFIQNDKGMRKVY
uniref:Secreted protein n=1 Tax=Brugia timori TaxID=42155 RepID=A0A0R3RAU6_9BILA